MVVQLLSSYFWENIINPAPVFWVFIFTLKRNKVSNSWSAVKWLENHQVDLPIQICNLPYSQRTKGLRNYVLSKSKWLQITWFKTTVYSICLQALKRWFYEVKLNKIISLKCFFLAVFKICFGNDTTSLVADVRECTLYFWGTQVFFYCSFQSQLYQKKIPS